jgi:hypothetical protein
MLQSPEFLSGTFYNWTIPDIQISVNATVLAYYGIWDNTTGETDIQFQFGLIPIDADDYDDGVYFDGTPVEYDGLDGVFSLFITPEMANKYLTIRVIASRDGVSIDDYYMFYYITDQVFTPELGGQLTPPIQTIATNELITKPTYNWAAGATIEPITISGEWYKNGLPTGVTSSTFPNVSADNIIGRTTDEGDLVTWYETCTNAVGTIGTSHDPTIITGVPSSLFTVVSDIIPNLKTHTQSEISNRISGLSGGAMHMDLFKNVNSTVTTAEWNENCWAYDLREQLSAHYLRMRFNGAPHHARYGYFLITPRHILTCLHSGLLATNDNRSAIFLTPDNRIVEAQVISSSATSIVSEPNGFDIQILLLDRDMSLEGIPCVPILSFDDKYRRIYNHYTNDSFLPMVGVSKSGIDEPAFFRFGNPKSDYDSYHERMLYIRIPRAWFPGSEPYPAIYNGYHYNPYSGDSGGPTMILAYNKFFLCGIHLDASHPGNPMQGENRFAIPNIIADADARGIAKGLLNSPTGMLPTFVDIADLETYANSI